MRINGAKEQIFCRDESNDTDVIKKLLVFGKSAFLAISSSVMCLVRSREIGRMRGICVEIVYVFHRYGNVSVSIIPKP